MSATYHDCPLTYEKITFRSHRRAEARRLGERLQSGGPLITCVRSPTVAVPRRARPGAKRAVLWRQCWYKKCRVP
eukprot:276073-Rhodomonas_salina.3